MSSRPADSRTTDCGMVMRATAIVRTNSSGSSPPPLASGVPSTWTSMLIGTDSGCTGRLASAAIMPTRSSRASPMPTMPPQHTWMPASRTCPSVSSRSR